MRAMEGGSPTDQHGPTRVGKYELRHVIGRGSIGVVYDASDLVLKRKVAIKTLPFLDIDTPLGQEKYQRFQREAQAAARLYHPNIAITFDYGETDAFAYIVMEYIDGPSVRELLEKTRVTIDQIRTIMQGLLAGLQHSHDLGVVHRDIKPANILLNQSGQVKITDFGIAHLDGSDLTQLGSQVGTPAYMSPEQVLGDKVDARSDVYSAGVVLYEMLTGSRPFQGSTNSVMHKIVHAPAPRVSESTAAFPPALDAVVATVLAKDPNDRYQTAAAFSSALTEYLYHPDDAAESPATIEPAVDSTIVRSGNWTREILTAPPVSPVITPVRRWRARVLVPVIGAVCVVLAGLAWFSVHRTGGSATQPIAANHADTRPNPAPAKIAAISPPANPPPANPTTANPTTANPTTANPTAANPTTAVPNTTAVPPPAAAVTPPSAANTKPAEPPHNTAPAPDRRPELLAGLHGAVAKFPCSSMKAVLDNGTTVTLSGLTALGEASELEIRGLIRQSIAQLLPAASVVWQVHRVKGPYCAVFDLLRPVSDGSRPAPSVEQDPSGPGRFRVTMPNFAGSLMVDVYSGDGLVHHRLPASGKVARKLPANAAVPIEQPAVTPGTDTAPANTQVNTQANAPPDVLTAIASSVPLLEAVRPAEEPAAGYLKDLGDAISRVRTSGATVAANAISVDPASPN